MSALPDAGYELTSHATEDMALLFDDAGEDGDAPAPPLRLLLVVADLLSIAGGWAAATAALVVLGTRPSLTFTLLHGTILLAVGALLLSANGLYRRRICAVRTTEIARLVRSGVALAALTALLLYGRGIEDSAVAALVGAVAWTALLTLERGLFREWIQVRRASGQFGAPVLVVGGTEASARRTAEFLAENPYLGFRVSGVVGPAGAGTDDGGAVTWGEGGARELRREAQCAGCTGVVLDANSLTGDQLNEAVRELTAANLHVHISSGLRGVDSRRITVSPMADETFLHVAPLTLNRRQFAAKRVTDVAIATLALLVLSPVLALSALAVWATDRGPILFRQQRVGHNGEPFTLYKLRTMVVDAELRLDDLLDDNARSGPLFKASDDPRITPIGRFLRASSIDELPQLLNVLEGTMSIVGPRPALPTEVASFDERLHARLTVKPGVTGSWQVEARDLPNFDLYRRLDLLYVQNWSYALDMAIIARTILVVLSRTVRAVVPSRVRTGVLE